MTASVAILVPAMRPQNLQRLVDTIAESTTDYGVVIVATGECADVARTLEGPITVIDDGGGSYAKRINLAFRLTTEPYALLASDDLSFRPGWFEAAMIQMNQVNGVVGINDLYNMSGVHFLISRDYVNDPGAVIDAPGLVCHEGYGHAYVDDELRHTAQYHGRWAFARDAVIEHMHPGAGKAEPDDVYAIGQASMEPGRAVFMSRRHLWGQ